MDFMSYSANKLTQTISHALTNSRLCDLVFITFPLSPLTLSFSGLLLDLCKHTNSFPFRFVHSNSRLSNSRTNHDVTAHLDGFEMKRHPRKNPAFMQSARQHSEHGTQVSESALKQARKTGQLNLSSRSLEVRHNILLCTK